MHDAHHRLRAGLHRHLFHPHHLAPVLAPFRSNAASISVKAQDAFGGGLKVLVRCLCCSDRIARRLHSIVIACSATAWGRHADAFALELVRLLAH